MVIFIASKQNPQSLTLFNNMHYSNCIVGYAELTVNALHPALPFT